MVELRAFAVGEVPFQPGESPFRLKGAAFRESLALYASLPGGLEAVMRALPNDAHRRFFTQPFTASGWYDVFAMAQLDFAAAAVAGVSPFTIIQRASVDQARNAITGIHRGLINIMSTKQVGWALPRVMASFFDFTQCTTQGKDDGTVTGICHGVPKVLCAWYEVATTEWTLEVLRIRGSKAPSASWRTPVVTGLKHGVAVARMEFQLEP
jgi:hypothetical protein